MALGYVGDISENYDKKIIAVSLKNYDEAWKDCEELKKKNYCAPHYKNL